jgi:hypothetical protein
VYPNLTLIAQAPPPSSALTYDFFPFLKGPHQDRICSDIRIKKTKEFEQVMSQSFSLDEQWT